MLRVRAPANSSAFKAVMASASVSALLSTLSTTVCCWPFMGEPGVLGRGAFDPGTLGIDRAGVGAEPELDGADVGWLRSRCSWASCACATRTVEVSSYGVASGAVAWKRTVSAVLEGLASGPPPPPNSRLSPPPITRCHEMAARGAASLASGVPRGLTFPSEGS